MAPLPTDQRKLLEKAITEARVVAEAGAREAIASLAVGRHEPHGSMSPEQRALRNRLRAHGRQLGDGRDKARGTQETRRLEREVAYEHWHRMLFARFLAENHLLIGPVPGVPITLEECEDLAREQGVDPWELAAGYAEHMLPQIFRTDDPALAVTLPPEARQQLRKLLVDLPAPVFTADDSLGWTYQFWQSAEKDAVNARVKTGEKITGETLPAVTQLFTEHYMVQFLLDNTIGAWHAGKTLSDDLRASAVSEQELRDAVHLAALDGYDFEYLRFVREAKEDEDLNAGTGPWRPAAGIYDGWPKTAAELRVLDPCCGSGHFLVAAFDLLVRLRIAEEGLDTEAAVRAVLADNLFGLELDARCTQIAAFNLALAAWKLAGKPIDLPSLNIACSGLGPQSTKDEWLKMAERELDKEPAIAREPIRRGLIHMHELFSDAPELGSLIDPSELPAEGFAADFETIKPLLDRILAAESADDEAHERAVAARGMASAAEILEGGEQGYTLVITNVPYLGRGSQSDGLKAFADANYKEAKADLATIFVARIVRWVGDGRNDTQSGTIAAVTPQNWLFLTSYKKLRERLLKDRSWEVVARLGPGAFETIGGHVVNVALLGISGAKAGKGHIMSGVDVSAASPATAKAALLQGEAVYSPAKSDTAPDDGAADGSVRLVSQAIQINNPDARVLLSVSAASSQVKEIASPAEGLSTGDGEQYVHCFWEHRSTDDLWHKFQTSPASEGSFGGQNLVLKWENDGETLSAMDGARVQGEPAWGRLGVLVARVSSLRVCIYSGTKFEKSCVAVVPERPEHLPALWAFASSSEFVPAIRRLDTKPYVTTAVFGSLPFDLDYWKKVAAEKYPNGLPEPQSDDPTQWLFHGRPERADPYAVLQVGVARLVGYRWPAELDEDMRLAPEARELVKRCDELLGFADDDGIVCLSSVRGEPGAAERLRALLAAAFGAEWSAAKERELLQAAADRFSKGRAPESLEEWLRDRFFEEHCSLFHGRPFVWHIWDGERHGFNALVNYHKLAGPDGEGRRTLESLTYSYLNDWIERQKAAQRAEEAGADARLAAALELQGELKKIIAGEPPYDIFVRWKPLAEQPLGWEPDINDGVRLNIRPFVLAEDMGRKGAGILKAKPDNTWGNAKKPGVSDRGKEPEKLRPREQFPWFWGCEPEKQPEHRVDFGAGLKEDAARGIKASPPAGRKFDGVRWNGLHYSRAAKEGARRDEE